MSVPPSWLPRKSNVPPSKSLRAHAAAHAQLATRADYFKLNTGPGTGGPESGTASPECQGGDWQLQVKGPGGDRQRAHAASGVAVGREGAQSAMGRLEGAACPKAQCTIFQLQIASASAGPGSGGKLKLKGQGGRRRAVKGVPAAAFLLCPAAVPLQQR